jgi:ubiquinone/menaquinone biosynthesis C-methylase UbiE
MMAKFHFVEDYEQLVAELINKYPIEEAMSLAVGGGYEKIGRIEADILAYAGLVDGMSAFDLGCGSGRLAVALSRRFEIDFTGTDVVQQLLDYAASKTPNHYRFIKNDELMVPMADQSIDVASAFSVFTHLLHEETYLYLIDMRRALKPGGKLVFSHLEFAAEHHWDVFESTVKQRKASNATHLNMFIDKPAISVWAQHLELDIIEFVPGSMSPWGSEPLGQSVVILKKPAC